MVKKYLEPEVEVVEFAATDVILASPAIPENSPDDFTTPKTGTPGAII